MTTQTRTPAAPVPDGCNGRSNGRAPDGRFTKNNGFGGGNPYTRAVAARRKALLDAVTADDVAAVARKLLAQALEGDTASAKVLFLYTVGKPGPAADPDNVDADAVARLMNRPSFPEVLLAMDAPSLDHALQLLCDFAPADLQEYVTKSAAGLRREQEQREARQQAAEDAYRRLLERRAAEPETTDTED